MFDNEAFKATLREVLRGIVREEVRAAFAEARPVGEDGYLSVEKAAALVEVHPDTIRGWVKAKRLPEHRAGREIRVRLDELRDFLDGRQAGAEDRTTPEEEAAAILARRRVG